MIDFFRFNCYFAKELFNYQPISEKPEETLNLMRYRPLEGFIGSVTPFNFTAIAGNLAYTPTIMVSVVVVYHVTVVAEVMTFGNWLRSKHCKQFY